MFLRIYFIICVFVIKQLSCFNLSPFPSLTFVEPSLNFAQPQVEPSFFGYTINLRDKRVIVGAPRAQSTLEIQRNFNETGAIYRCDYTKLECTPFIVDRDGGMESAKDGFFSDFIKSSQWLGAVMDGHSLDTDRLIVCAPNIVTNLTDHHLFNGVCYVAENTASDQPTIRKWDPLRRKSQQAHNEQYVFMFGQLGFSVHITDNGEEFLIGAPGLLQWKGSVIRYRPETSFKPPGMSRRDLGDPSTRISYEHQIPSPAYWNQQDDSLLGYAVSSGNFRAGSEEFPELLYVASAPQGNLQSGEVLIYDYAMYLNNQELWSIKVHKKFYSKQMGEYFGYALLVDDFNGDGVMDIVISAPLHSDTYSNENGRVYVYINKGDMRFVESKPLYSDYNGNGRFGTTLGRIHDINKDGFKDIAISAPHEENGVVYIHLGGPNGISSKPSQKIVAPPNDRYPTANFFGFGLSKGVDIDENGFNDLAIGAPNTDTVYVYKSYPVIRMDASIGPYVSAISTNEATAKIQACYGYLSIQPISYDVKALITIKLDPQRNRAKFSNGETELSKSVIIGSRFCEDHDIVLKYSVYDIFNPIVLELHSELEQKIENQLEFCETCVAVNPADPQFVTSQIIFSTGCENPRCVSDLNLKSTLDSKSFPYILGSARSIGIEYVIENFAESAYLVTLTIEIPRMVSFYRIPSNCDLIETNLICVIVRGRPLKKGDKTTFNIALDVTRLEGTELLVVANVTSSGDELNPEDNVLTDTIPLTEFSEIEVVGSSSLPISVEEIGLVPYTVKQRYEIKNNGPSHLKHIKFSVMIPMGYITDYPYARMDLVDPKSIQVKGEFDHSPLELKWSHRNLSSDYDDTTDGLGSIIVIDNMNGLGFDSSKQGLDFEMGKEDIGDGGLGQEFGDENTLSLNRRRRESSSLYTYNQYTQRLTEHHNVSRARRSVVQQYDPQFSALPHSRLIYFNCTNDNDDSNDEHFCIKANFDIKNFQAGEKRIVVDISFEIDLKKVDGLYTDLRDIFLMVTTSRVEKPEDPSGDSLKVITLDPYMVVTKYLKQETPIWVIIVSTIVGLLILILLVYGLYRAGFFKRSKKEEMEQQKLTDRRSQLQSLNDNVTDDEL